LRADVTNIFAYILTVWFFESPNDYWLAVSYSSAPVTIQA
jgi:hypothetical protein